MNEHSQGRSGAVLPLFRGPVHLDAKSMWGVSDETFAVLMREASVPVRQNVMRILPATLAAEKTGNPLLFMEGWRGHTIDGLSVEGCEVSRALLLILRQRELVSSAVSTVIEPVSRCTEEEAWGARRRLEGCREGESKPELLGITEVPCPSPARVRRAFEELTRDGSVTTHVLTPQEAVDAFAVGGLDSRQRKVWDAVQLTPAEVLAGKCQEVVNGTVDLTGRIIDILRMRGRDHEPFIAQLAHALRPDSDSDASRTSLPIRLLDTLRKKPRGALSDAARRPLA